MRLITRPGKRLSVGARELLKELEAHMHAVAETITGQADG